MEPYVGEIRMFAGNFAPRGWALCQGQLLSVSQYDALFSLLGTIYGGDGQTTFGLPDLRGRIPIHYGPGTGLTPRPLFGRQHIADRGGLASPDGVERRGNDLGDVPEPDPSPDEGPDRDLVGRGRDRGGGSALPPGAEHEIEAGVPRGVDLAEVERADGG